METKRFGQAFTMQLRNSLPNNPDEQKNPPELPIGRFLKSKSLGGNRVILVVRPLNRIADDGDLIVGNPREPIPALARCVMDRHDVHS